MFYIFNKNLKCVGCCDVEPDLDDLNSRDEFYVQSDEEFKNLNNLYVETDSGKNSIVAKETTLTETKLAATERKKRNELIDRVSREINRKEDLGEDSSLWRKYRVFLRDIPEQENFPHTIDWGELPEDFSGK